MMRILRVIFDIFLFPLSFIWEWVYRIRRFAYNYGIFKQNQFLVPIISIGNISFGGTGKTPFTLWLAQYLDSLDKKVSILLRGYKGGLEHGRGILRGGIKLGFNPVDYGDEALMLARRLDHASVIVGKNRSENLEHYFDSERPDVVLLDDGHQHLKLARKLNIVIFDSLMPLSRYKVAPRGYLREGFHGLRDADVVIFGRADQASEKKIRTLKSKISPYLRSDVVFGNICYRPVGFYNRNNVLIHSPYDVRGKNVICVAGIAAPKSFYTLVESLGAKVIKKISFPDHHLFNPEEVQSLIQTGRNNQAIVITTEKDMVKIKRITEEDTILYLQISIHFIQGEEEIKDRIHKSI